MTPESNASHEGGEADVDLSRIIDDLLGLEDDGGNRFNAVWHVFELVQGGDISEADARTALLDQGFQEEEIDDVFDGGWAEAE